MKKVILFAAILFAGVSVVNAQDQKVKLKTVTADHNSVTEGVKKTASTDLTVVLNTIQSISVNTSGVTLEYTTVDDYTQGVRSGVIADHLEVNSTGAYDVKVSYATETDSYSESTGYSAADMFESIEVAVERADAPTGVTVDTKKLATEPTESIITSTIGEFGAKFGVDYRGAIDYINSIKKGETRTYTAQVTYTITPN